MNTYTRALLGAHPNPNSNPSPNFNSNPSSNPNPDPDPDLLAEHVIEYTEVDTPLEALG